VTDRGIQIDKVWVAADVGKVVDPVIASGDALKEVMLEPPRVGRQGANHH